MSYFFEGYLERRRKEAVKQSISDFPEFDKLIQDYLEENKKIVDDSLQNNTVDSKADVDLKSVANSNVQFIDACIETILDCKK